MTYEAMNQPVCTQATSRDSFTTLGFRVGLFCAVPGTAANIDTGFGGGVLFRKEREERSLMGEGGANTSQQANGAASPRKTPDRSSLIGNDRSDLSAYR